MPTTLRFQNLDRYTRVMQLQLYGNEFLQHKSDSIIMIRAHAVLTILWCYLPSRLRRFST
jgi:hypothetical protein